MKFFKMGTFRSQNKPFFKGIAIIH